jgi:hypothetical protein
MGYCARVDWKAKAHGFGDLDEMRPPKAAEVTTILMGARFADELSILRRITDRGMCTSIRLANVYAAGALHR